MTLAQFTEPNLLVPRLLSESRDHAVAELSNRLENVGRIENARAFMQAVLNHESLVSAVFDEVAFPLARGTAVKELSFAIGLSQPGICWGVSRAPTVHVVVLFAVPLSAEQNYLSLVMSFANFLKDEIAFSALRGCAQPEDMFTVLKHVHCVRMAYPSTDASGAPASPKK
jgi:mannitol/fructose-specific phosphotransferase system IIA component (Ntr-type)